MAGKIRIEFTQWAEFDLNEIITYIAENDNVHDALHVFYNLKEKIAELDQLVERGRIVPELKRIKIFEFKEIIHKPYRIIYKIEDNLIYIIAIFDGRREIDDIIYRRIIEI